MDARRVAAREWRHDTRPSVGNGPAMCLERRPAAQIRGLRLVAVLGWPSFSIVKVSARLAKPLGNQGIRQPCLKDYLRFRLDCFSPSRFMPRPCRPWSGQNTIRTATSSGRAINVVGHLGALPEEAVAVAGNLGQDNPQVRNPHPHLSGRRSSCCPAVTSATVRVRWSRTRCNITSLDDAVKPIPLSALKQFLKQARVIGEDEYEHAPHVVGIEDTQLRGTAGQLAYVRWPCGASGRQVRDRPPGRPLLRHAAARRRSAARGLSPDQRLVLTDAPRCSGRMAVFPASTH